jgi:ankyrin repeat protein
VQPATAAVEIFCSSEFPPDNRDKDLPDDRQIKMPANVDQGSASGSTPLSIAVSMREHDIIRVLLAANTDQLDLASENRDLGLPRVEVDR